MSNNVENINIEIPESTPSMYVGMRGQKGDTGATPDLTIGTVATGAAGSSASATITGTKEAPVLNLTIPKGDEGDKGDKGEIGDTPELSIGTVTTGAAGSSASVTISGTTAAPVLNFTIPKGDKGDSGNTDVTASAYSTSKTYAVGDYVIYNNNLYRCTTAITTAEAWTSGHWTQVALASDVSDLRADIEDISNLDKSTVKTDLEGWANGRILQGSFTASNSYAYSDTYANDHNPIYFDDSVYKVGFCYFSNAVNDPTQSGCEVLGSWITQSPATNSSTKPYYRLSITRLDTGAINPSNVSMYIEKKHYTELVESVIHAVNEIGVEDIDAGTPQSGYYSLSHGEALFNADVNSKAYIIDLTDYIGDIVTVDIASSGTTSTRITALCDNDGVVSDFRYESSFALRGPYNFYPTNTYKYLYLSYKTENVSDFSVKAFSALGKDVKTLMGDYAPQAVYVDGVNGSDTNNGLRRNSAFKTIQKAINSGAHNILIREGTYDGFSMLNANDINIQIDHYYDSFTVGSDEDNPKVIIDGNGSAQDGIVLTNCSNIKISNIEVKDCVVSGVYLSQCSDISLFDCIVHDIYKATKDAVSYGYRFVSTDCDCYNCLAYNIGTDTAGQSAYHCDGFNIHNTGTVNLFNCSAYNCEDDGVSHHDACCGVIDGGEWYHCGKGGIASPTHGAKVNVQNVYSHDNGYGIYAGNDYAVTDRGNILIANCVFKDNSSKDVYATAYYNLIMMNCIYDTYQATNITVFGQ